MSFTLLDRVRSLQSRLDTEINHGPELDVDTPEYCLKQAVIMAIREELQSLNGKVDELLKQWDINAEQMPEAMEDFEDRRDWEGRIAAQRDEEERTRNNASSQNREVTDGVLH